MADTLAQAIGALSTTGIESYEISQGANVNVTSVDGVGEVTVGNPISNLFTGGSGWLIIIVVGIIAIVFLRRPRRG